MVVPAAAPRPAHHSLGPTHAQAAAHPVTVAAGGSSAPGMPHGSPECLGAHEPKVLRGGWGVRQRGRAGVLPWTVLLQGVSQPLLGVGRADCMKWSAAIVPVQRRAARAAPPSCATTKNGNLITTVQKVQERLGPVRFKIATTMESKRRCVRAVFLVATALASASAGFPGSSATATATVPALVDLVEYRCDAQVGLKLPLPVCNQSIAPLTQCELTGGEVVRLPGINNISRPFCRITPALGARKVPLVLFFHCAFGSADGVINDTNLVDFARNWSWPGGTSEGFVLAAPSGACLSWPRTGSNDGYHWDFYHRDLGSSSTNPDVALADAIIDAEVQRGTVDPSRIFVMGWSNGGFFGQMYAVARNAKRGAATPGGNFVAAASVYTAADPFNNDTFLDQGSRSERYLQIKAHLRFKSV